jgi:hypothetical protein
LDITGVTVITPTLGTFTPAVLFIQKFTDSLTYVFNCAEFAFPYDKGAPPERCKSDEISLVALPVPGKLCGPECLTTLRSVREGTTRMLMPKTSMHEDHLASPRKDQVRPTRKIRAMEPVAVAHGENHPPDEKFWHGILPANAAHHTASRFGA